MNVLGFLEYFEKIVDSNMKNFQNKFCCDNEVIHLRFYSNGVEFIYLTSKGQHIVDSIDSLTFSKWCDEVMYDR